jgi:hypothetical protein
VHNYKLPLKLLSQKKSAVPNFPVKTSVYQTSSLLKDYDDGKLQLNYRVSGLCPLSSILKKSVLFRILVDGQSPEIL